MQAHIDVLLALADQLGKDDIRMLIEKAFLEGDYLRKTIAG